MNRLEYALKYYEQGFSVIPIIPGQKKPLIKWQRYQKERATPEQIREWWTKTPDANIGIVTGEISGVFVIDLDKHDPKYNEEDVLQYIPDNIDCPVVNTPKDGQHLYFLPPEEEITIGSRFIPGCDFRGDGGYVLAPPSSNGNGKPYTWAIPFDRARLARPPKAAIKRIIENTLYRDACKDHVSNGSTNPYNTYNTLQGDGIFESGKRDESLFHIANCLAKTGNDEEYIRQVLKSLIASWGETDDKWVDTKIKSAFDRKTRKDRNIHEEIREYILTQKSLQETYISLTATLQSLQLLTKEEKNAAYVAFNRMCNVDKVIEKHGDRRGEYRILDGEKEKSKMDLLSDCEIQEFPVRMPIDLNDMCVVSPGNIIVVSGSKSSGKTAMMMNIAWMNQNKFEVVYLNSEMHETEFKKRMKKFAPLANWKIAGYKCHNNFDDYIESKSNRVYIVDYLEVHDNFYEIAKPIRKIHEKLGDAICIIGIQMKSGASLGRGGDFSAEKARLYLTMDYSHEEKRTKVTIYDAKEPRPPLDNVRGKWRNVKIIDGHRISPFTEWQW